MPMQQPLQAPQSHASRHFIENSYDSAPNHAPPAEPYASVLPPLPLVVAQASTTAAASSSYGVRPAGRHTLSAVLSDTVASPLVVIEVDPSKCISGLFTESIVYSILAPFGTVVDLAVVGNVAQTLFSSVNEAAAAVATLSGHEGHTVLFGNLLQ